MKGDESTFRDMIRKTATTTQSTETNNLQSYISTCIVNTFSNELCDISLFGIS